MIRLILRRALMGIPLVLVVATVAFFLVQFTPGSPAAAVLGTQATPEAIARFETGLGLDRPVLVQYAEYMGRLLVLDLGESWLTEQPVAEILASRLPVTMTLATLATLVAMLIGILIGTGAAVRGGWIDRVLTGGSGVGLALPNFWLASILVLIFSLNLALVPATGYVPFTSDPAQWANHLILPVATLAIAMIASFARQTRTSMIEQLSSDYVRTLRGAGISRASIVSRHTLRNAAAPVLNTAGLQFVGVLGGAIIIEQVFALPGLGRAIVQSASARDLPVLLGAVVVSAIVVLIVNIVIDVAVAALNPRARIS
ncbi:ABC transporter permease [Microbacterium sp. LRZ72]|uniref:ABC transporter permease n=1 Tax=Microbacterium sp. LRZ72 TaxID=2942481 RepID=UPI0029BB22B7|nr:ABC transporter permease [Microbacterium sp. LRZ72]MDX2377855.1 ABC transporter permease [Microbacterium sp. LRZ72]